LLFGIGSIIGMMLVSGLIGLPILLTNRVSSINRVFRYVTAVISFIIGAKILFEIGMLNIPLHL
ncbi:MAG: high frequency lysogenization protein HflD, partial [Nitrosarchaeum sp.]